METNVNMTKEQFGVYDIALGEWLDKREFQDIVDKNSFDVNDIMTSLYDNVIMPTDSVRRDVVEMLLHAAYVRGLSDCKAYIDEEAENNYGKD